MADIIKQEIKKLIDNNIIKNDEKFNIIIKSLYNYIDVTNKVDYIKYSVIVNMDEMYLNI